MILRRINTINIKKTLFLNNIVSVLFCAFLVVSLSSCLKLESEQLSPSKNLSKNIIQPKKIKSFKDITFPKGTDINFSKKVKVNFEKMDGKQKVKGLRVFTFSRRGDKRLILSSIIHSRDIRPYRLELPVGTKGFIIQKYDAKNHLISRKIVKNNTGEISIGI